MNTPHELTLFEKASLASGADFMSTKAVGNVARVTFSDGPHGLRKQSESVDHLGVAMSTAATCFPPASGLSQSWNEALVSRIGAALGREARAHNVDVLLGPGVNIKRHPLGGRNFEYFSEDPHLSAALGTAWVSGIQAEGVGASVKHFAANNQETDRHRISADIDPRTLREIYLRSFQRVVEEAKPWTVMCAYNAVNGVLASENSFLLTRVLRDDWAFDGVVVSDWGAVADRVAAAAAGLDLQMPATDGVDELLVEAVTNGSLDEAVVDRIVSRVSALAATAQACSNKAGPFDADDNHELAREAARQSIVLLKNDGQVLPFDPAVSVAVIGEAALSPRFQGGGSSFVNASRVDIPLEEMQKIGASVSYSAGYSTGAGTDAAALKADAVAAARIAENAVVFVAADIESEGFDRENLDLPSEQVELVLAVLAANPRTIVVLARGGVLRMAPFEDVPAILDGALLGQGIGRAIADVIFGQVNPSGRLSETIPERLEDTPAFGSFPGEHGHAVYGEGHLVGYRWYDARTLPVAFPFGHGLSYTTFEYTNLALQSGDEGILATVTVTNSGALAGREVAQFYVGLPSSEVNRAPRELKGFASIDLSPGESATVTVLLRRSDLCYWDTRSDGWTLESGSYLVSVGASSRDIRQSLSVDVRGDLVAVSLSFHSTIGELLANPITEPAVRNALALAFGEAEQAAVGGNVVKMISPSPLNSVMGLLGDSFDAELFEELLAQANSEGVPSPI